MSKALRQQAAVRTNTIKDSVCAVDVEAVKFADLWEHYPDEPPYIDPKTGKPPAGYENQCAIKVSAAIHKAGIEMKSFRGRSVTLDGKKSAILATQLADWLSSQPFCGLPQKAENITGEDWEKKIRGRTGIVYFADYWQRTGERGETRTGDHIDLWNGSRLTNSAANFARRFGLDQVQWLPRFGSLDRFNYSDLAISKFILFWEVK